MFIGNNISMITPCISQCGLDENNICTGCYRTKAEISDWFHIPEDKKIAIVIRCKKKIAKSLKDN